MEKKIKCRHCSLPIQEGDGVKYATYWHGHTHTTINGEVVPIMVHRHCEKQCKETEAIECQKIDADCNDCKHFIRGKMIGKGSGSCFEGHCKKFDKPTKAYPNFCSGHACFEHRKS